MLIHTLYIVYGTCSKQQQDDIPLVLGSLSQDFVTGLFGPYAAAILCGRGVTRYFDSLQHVAHGRAHSWYHFEVILPLGFESMQNGLTKVQCECFQCECCGCMCCRFFLFECLRWFGPADAKISTCFLRRHGLQHNQEPTLQGHTVSHRALQSSFPTGTDSV